MRISSEVSMIGSGQIGLSSPFDCHVYAVRTRAGVVIIDSGSGLGEDSILRELRNDFPGLRVEAILLTHAHADHAAGAKSLSAALNCEVIAGHLTKTILEAADEDRSGLAHARLNGAYPAELRLQPTNIKDTLQHGQTIDIDGLRFEAIHVRGHSEDSVCYAVALASGTALFSGDIVFYGGTLGVINAYDSGMQGYVADMHRLQGKQVNMLFPSHGLFTLTGGQHHIDRAIFSCNAGFLPRQIGQGDSIF